MTGKVNFNKEFWQSLAAKFYLFFLASFYLGFGLLGLYLIVEVLPFDELSFFNVSDLRETVRDQDERIRVFDLEISSLREENKQLKLEIKELTEVLEDATTYLEFLKNDTSKIDEALRCVYFIVVAIPFYGYILPYLKFNDHQPEINIINIMLKDLEFVLSAFLRMNNLANLEFFDLSAEDHKYIEQHLRKLIKALIELRESKK